MDPMKPAPAQPSVLIPEHLTRELHEQDEARARARRKASYAAFRNTFINKHALEIEMIRRGAVVTEVDPVTGQVLAVELPGTIKPVVAVYTSVWKERVSRYWGNFLRSVRGLRWKWQNTRFTLNEGGRGVTLSIVPLYDMPFRLYVAGWVLMRSQSKWSLRDQRSR
jgi:hypothetical protein